MTYSLLLVVSLAFADSAKLLDTESCFQIEAVASPLADSAGGWLSELTNGNYRLMAGVDAAQKTDASVGPTALSDSLV